jgi:hypothetical protein
MSFADISLSTPAISGGFTLLGYTVVVQMIFRSTLLGEQHDQHPETGAGRP